MITGLFENLPVDRSYVLVAALAAVVLWGLGRWLRRSGLGSRLLDVLQMLENSFLATLLLSMIFLSFLQVVLRNFADAGFVWIDPLLRHLLLWIGFLGALVATRTGRHISIDALSRVLPPQVLRVTGPASNLLAFLVSLLVSNACLKLIHEEWLAATVGFLEIPIWMLQMVMPVAAFAMAVRFLERAWQAAHGHSGQIEPGDGSGINTTPSTDNKVSAGTGTDPNTAEGTT